MFTPVSHPRLGFHNACLSCLSCLSQAAKRENLSIQCQQLRRLTTTTASSTEKSIPVPISRVTSVIKGRELPIPVHLLRKQKSKSSTTVPLPTAPKPPSTVLDRDETSDFWKNPLSLGASIAVIRPTKKSKRKKLKADKPDQDRIQPAKDESAGSVNKELVKDGDGSKDTLTASKKSSKLAKSPEALPNKSSGKKPSSKGKLPKKAPPPNSSAAPTTSGKAKAKAKPSSPSVQQPSSVVVPVQSAKDELVRKLKAVAVEQGKRMTKKALLELLDSGALTNAGRSMMMRKLRRSLLVTQSHPDIETVIEQASSRAPILAPKILSPDNADETRGTIKEAMLSKKGKPAEKILQPIDKKKGMTDYDIQSIDASKLQLTPHEKPQPPVPTLAYGLERALFNPGVYQLRDPRSRVFNFDPYLQTIMPVAEFDFSALKEYVTSSRDKALISTANELKKKYTGSTSSMTAALAHFHYLLSQWRDINISNLSKGFPDNLLSFSGIQRAPAAIFLRWKNGVYAIDADKEYDTPNILSMLGKSMEKLLTLPTENFEKYRKDNSDQITAEERNELESFHYTTMGDFLMRSQLDAYDPRLPGTGMFDLKTRAVVSIRVDAEHFEKGVGYEIRGRHGEYHSYEREYYDMIRSAFLKYSLQVRMGRMDGIFVAFHNTERIFGFQYISISEMDFAIHGTEDTTLGDAEFKVSLELLNRVLDRATAKFPEQSLRIHFEARQSESSPFLYIFAKPVTDQQIDKIQNASKQEIERFERKVLGLHSSMPLEDVSKDEAENKDEQAKAAWEVLQALVEEEISNDELDVDTTDSPTETAAAQENLDHNGSLSETSDLDEAEIPIDELLSAINSDDLLEEGAVIESGHTSDAALDDVQRAAPTSVIESLGLSQAASMATESSNVEIRQADSDINTTIESSGEVFHEEEVMQTGARSEETLGQVDDTESGGFEESAAQSGKSSKLNTTPAKTSKKDETKNLLAMYMTIRNKQNGEYVQRPENLSKDDNWTVEYALAQIPEPRAITLYKSALTRRKSVLVSGDKESSNYRAEYMKMIGDLVAQGREFRERQDKLDQSEPMKVFDVPEDEATT